MSKTEKGPSGEQRFTVVPDGSLDSVYWGKGKTLTELVESLEAITAKYSQVLERLVWIMERLEGPPVVHPEQPIHTEPLPDTMMTVSTWCSKCGETSRVDEPN